MQVRESDAQYRQCMYITDTYPISRGKLVHEIKMYESGMWALSLDIGSSRLNLGEFLGQARGTSLGSKRTFAYAQKGGLLWYLGHRPHPYSLLSLMFNRGKILGACESLRQTGKHGNCGVKREWNWNCRSFWTVGCMGKFLVWGPVLTSCLLKMS